MTDQSPPFYRVAESANLYSITDPVTDDDIIAFSAVLLERRILRSPSLQTVPDSKEFLIRKFAPYDREVFACLFLTTRNQVIAYEELFFGTIDGAHVHPRVVVQRVIHHKANAIILAHNHPSGEPEPSQADRQITARIKEVLALIDVRTLDHIVVGGASAKSFAELGIL